MFFASCAQPFAVQFRAPERFNNWPKPAAPDSEKTADLSSGKTENLAGVKVNSESMQHSITDLDKVREACRGVDYVIHLASHRFRGR
jgi:nucleoside-diphosphate-sugar epimerase